MERTTGGDDTALGRFLRDVDMAGTALYGFAKRVVTETVSLGRAGVLVEWDGAEDRPYAVFYPAERVVNWREERVGGRVVLSLVVLAEKVECRMHLTPALSPAWRGRIGGGRV